MWFIWQIIAAVSITIYASLANHYGKISHTAGYLGLLVGVALVGWTVPIAYSKAPFIQAYVTQNGLMPVLGILISIFVFGESINMYQYGGILLITLGTIMMVLK